ncbi:BC1872 family protein [Paenibacillus camelliae]|uniref:BC1872 family protein n=1 Tax=Paenibacillus camelliae TaxID=512410 RepID=UPI00203C8F3B|nr:hypothetical protein [Paenibacillus camelliae]MCM3632881.1 hypothetical protein [Paenibacillus camelliae]
MNELTREQILSMPAGRELDNLIVKYVLRKTTSKDRPNWYLIYGTTSSSVQEWAKIPRYSTDIAAAWEVVGKMHEDERWTLALERDSETNEWIADFNELGLSPAGVGKTAQEAIIKAALLAVMGL